MSTEIALPHGYGLNEYRIESTLGIGGFGVTYLATDSNLNLKVAIKEYLPGDLAIRCEDQSVRPKGDSALETFVWGRSRFLDECRTLAAFRHPNIVRVMRFFEANKTAYMVMEFVAGQSLGDWIKPRRPLSEQALLAIAGPLLDGLDVIHRAGYLHRDIKPGNIFIREDGSPVLIDFGSARIVDAAAEMTAIVTPGYAPFEQYHSHGNQGPWTDLYSLGAVLYWIVTGAKPIEAAARVQGDPLVPASRTADRSRYSAELLKAIDWALAPSEKARPQTAPELKAALQQTTQPVTSDEATVIPPSPSPAPATDGSGLSGLATTAVFDRDTLKRLESALAPHLGPIATIVIRAAAKKAFTFHQLLELVSAEIDDDKVRAAFLKKFATFHPPAAAGDQSRPPSSKPLTQSVLASTQFDPGVLALAEAELARHLGALARVVVRRAASKARDETELYLVLADQIEDKDQRKAFIRKAMARLGRG